jgi:GH3 auxin-responsive promoter.
MVSNEMNISIPEFTVVGFPYENLFAHKWYLACNDKVDPDLLIKKIDEKICTINDDYAVERTSALKQVFVEVLPEEKFLQFMAQKGKLGSQHKFPRVLKGKMLEDWTKFLANGGL